MRALHDLRQNVQNASYEQKDPLVIYKIESFNLFERMLIEINKDITSFLCRAALPVPEETMRQSEDVQTDQRGIRTSREDVPQQRQRLATNGEQQERRQPIHVEKKVGRNDPCPCGSGKKYKNCHGRNAEE